MECGISDAIDIQRSIVLQLKQIATSSRKLRNFLLVTNVWSRVQIIAKCVKRTSPLYGHLSIENESKINYNDDDDEFWYTTVQSEKT